jgi:signal transduction histidine kinase
MTSLPGAAPCSSTLCASLAQGLHAAAQPLTILLAGLGQSNTRGMQTEELRELTASSAVEVQRVCALFHGLQQLVVAESIPPSLSLTRFPPLLLHVAEGIGLLLEQDGMHLKTVLPETCPPLLLDRERTAQALANVLLAAHAVARPHDTVEAAVSCPGAHIVRVVIRNDAAGSDTMPAACGLGMAVAEANIRSQRGLFSWSLRPFRVLIELRQAQRDAI